VAPFVGSRPAARAQDLPQSKLISPEENIGRTWAGAENHDNHIGSIWISLSQSLLSTFLVWIRNDVWPSTTHAMALYRRAGLPALAAWEARQFGHLLNEKRPKPPNPRGMVLAGLQV